MKTPFHFRSAFSLLELLVVVGVLAVMAAAGAVALGGGSRSLQGASSAMSSVFGQARTEAILRRVPARVIVDTTYNSSQPDNFNRRVAVVVSNDDGTTWTPVTKWTRLPGNAFYNPVASRAHGQVAISGLPGGASGPFDYFEFGPNGQASVPRSWIVLSNGVVNGGAFQEVAQENRAGFFIHRMGRPTFFSDPSQIPQS
ncbi:MAG: prepilin-type N-terminal cleavage/methylation domain-containing protein [Terrimicrobiaceae bacterium]|nr:prepilin-type N-terminal cleavage/methylation domain-containing protein [Terrimicrobiaceae bacterium]